MKLNRISAGMAITAAIGLGSVGLAQQASAATINEYVYTNGYGCPTTDSGGWDSFTLSYNSNQAGSYACFYGAVPTYAGYAYYSGSDLYNYVYVFNQSGGAGGGQAVKNNAASGCDESGTEEYTVYYNSSYQGASQFFGIAYSGNNCTNLNSTLKNENASQKMTAFA